MLSSEIKRKKKLYEKYLNNQNKLQVTKPTLAIAKKFIRELYEQKLTFHFDDCAVDCLYKTNKITTLKKAKAIQKTVDDVAETIAYIQTLEANNYGRVA